MKRRAGSAPSDDTPDAVDVDILANSEGVCAVEDDVIQGVEDTADDTVQSVFADDLAADDASTAGQFDDRDEDPLDLLGLSMDQNSVYEPQVGSDMDDNPPAADIPDTLGYEVEEQGPKQENTQEHDGESNSAQVNGSSTSNTDEAADSDAKTADTTGTNTSAEEPSKSRKSASLDALSSHIPKS